MESISYWELAVTLFVRSTYTGYTTLEGSIVMCLLHESVSGTKHPPLELSWMGGEQRHLDGGADWPTQPLNSVASSEEERAWV